MVCASVYLTWNRHIASFLVHSLNEVTKFLLITQLFAVANYYIYVYLSTYML